VLPERELQRLNTRVEEDVLNAIGDHRRRIERFRRYYRKWRNLVDAPAVGDEDASNFQVPLIQWQGFQKWARDLESLLGDDAEIVAKPTGPSDARLVGKVGRYMTWRLFQSMRITSALAIFDFRKILYGRAHAYRPWVRETYRVLEDDGAEQDELDYEGPGFYPLSPGDLLLPAEKDAQSIHDFSFVVRRYAATPDELLRGDGVLYQGIRDNFEQIVTLARNNRRRDMGEEVEREQDTAEGVDVEGGLSAAGTLIVEEWYGRWRRLRGKKDASEVNLKGREDFESDLVVRRCPDLNRVIGVQSLLELYPKMRRRRPFAEASLVKDGSYWCQGLGELLEAIEDESSATHRLLTEAGQFSVGPVIFAKPGVGVQEETFRYAPYQVVLTEDPAGVNAVRMQADLSPLIAKMQNDLSVAERVTGISDLALGRQSDRPNAPRTASGTIALLEQGNIRVALDTRMFREDMAIIASDLWELESQFSPESVFFRVTEEDAGGLFETSGGGALMTSRERGGRYDFDVRFATSVWSREANKERQLQLYGLDIQNPLIATNPRALWLITNRVHKALGDDGFADIIPEPPDLGQPKTPREEWNLALQGEDFSVNPMDNDDLHLVDHYRRVTEARRDPEQDRDAVQRMAAHIVEHQAQKRQKMLMQALTQQLARSMAGNTAETGGLLPGGVPAPLARVGQVVNELGGGEATGQPTGGSGAVERT
jgi:hypothetical protein